MALFKINYGGEDNLPTNLTEGYAYLCTDTGNFYVDQKDKNGTLIRKKISAEYADKLRYVNGSNTIEIDPAIIVTAENYTTTIGTATTSKNGLMASADKSKLDGIATGANKTTVDSSLSSTSTNPVQNKVIKAALDGKETSGAAVSALSEAKTYTDTKTSGLATETYVNDALDGKADASHAHDDRYYTETEVDTKLSGKSDTSHNHNSAYDTKGAAAAVQANLDAVSAELDEHTGDSDVHVTTTNKSNWNTAYNHSQATHARTDATKVADSTTNGNILINGTETNVYTHPSSGVTAGTYKSVTVNAQGHVTAGTNPTTLAGYGITDAEAKGAASNALTSAKAYTDSVASGKADSDHNHDSDYDTKGAANSALSEAKAYADTAATTVKNDLLNGAGTAYDTLKELGDLINDNQDAIDALETVAAGKADAEHSHAIADVTNLQSTLDGKAAKSHGTHVSYSSTAPVMDGTASVGSASTVARSDHKHPTDTSRASKTEFDTHVADTTVHITSTERSNWNATKTALDTLDSAYDAHKHTVSHTPAGTVSKPTFTGSEVTSGAASSTTSIYQITGVGTAASHSYTAPSLSASIANNCMTLSWSAGAHSFTANTVPTRSAVTVATAHTHSVTAEGSVSQPTFTGTAATLTSSTAT